MQDGVTMLEGMWFGGGALERDVATITQRIRLLGFNAVRLPFSMQDLFNASPKCPPPPRGGPCLAAAASPLLLTDSLSTVCACASVRAHSGGRCRLCSSSAALGLHHLMHGVPGQVLHAAVQFPHQQAAAGQRYTAGQWTSPSAAEHGG